MRERVGESREALLIFGEPALFYNCSIFFKVLPRFKSLLSASKSFSSAILGYDSLPPVSNIKNFDVGIFHKFFNTARAVRGLVRKAVQYILDIAVARFR